MMIYYDHILIDGKKFVLDKDSELKNSVRRRIPGGPVISLLQYLPYRPAALQRLVMILIYRQRVVKLMFV